MAARQKLITVLLSGHGSNLQAIIDAIAHGELDCQISAVISDKKDAFGLTRAQQHGITTHHVASHDFGSREAYDEALASLMEQTHADLFILAGFMRILSAKLVKHFDGKLINIHPSLLPKHPGLNTHQKVLASGDKEHGCSIHYVTEELDGGPIIGQRKLQVANDDTVETLKAKVHQLEHTLYPATIAELLSKIQ